MPDIWGDGKLLTFSGLDGPTSWAHTLVGGASTDPFGVVWHLRPDVFLVFGGRIEGQDARLVLGDAVELSVRTGDGAGDLRMACADCWTVVGETTGSLSVRLDGPTETEVGFVALFTDERDGVTRWCLALSADSPDEARARAEAERWSGAFDARLEALAGRLAAWPLQVLLNAPCLGLIGWIAWDVIARFWQGRYLPGDYFRHGGIAVLVTWVLGFLLLQVAAALALRAPLRRGLARAFAGTPRAPLGPLEGQLQALTSLERAVSDGY